jgi:hypothetical protein
MNKYHREYEFKQVDENGRVIVLYWKHKDISFFSNHPYYGKLKYGKIKWDERWGIPPEEELHFCQRCIENFVAFI